MHPGPLLSLKHLGKVARVYTVKYTTYQTSMYVAESW